MGEVIGMYKIGLSSCAFNLTDESFEKLRKSKIDVIEVSLHPNKYPEIDYKELERLSKDHGVGIWSFHLPFAPFSRYDACSLDKAIRDNTVNFCSELIKKSSDIGIDKFVIHPGSEPIDPEEREIRVQNAMQTLDTLAEVAHKCGSVIAVEDLPRTCIGNTGDEIARLISANDKLRVCFDTNHLLYEDNIDFMKKLGDKIITVHVSDYDFVNERHWMPGEGIIDWVKMMETFEEIGYNGAWMYEISLEIPKTLSRTRELTFVDFHDNAMTLFAKKQPKPLGLPIPEEL